MPNRGRLILIVAVNLSLVLFGAAYGQAAPGKSGEMSMLQEMMVHHIQGWGELGINTAAHQAGKEALPLQIGEKRYDIGLGSHAPSETTFLLEGGFVSLDCEVGIQLQDNKGGSVVFLILVDGKEVFNSGVRRGNDPPLPVSVALSGASELKLITEDAGDDYACDMANWAGLTLVPDAKTNKLPKDYSNNVNIAPAAKVASWDPARTTGTLASRLQPVPVEDLFLETTLLPDENGIYTATTYADGRACIGLEWFERRKVRQIEIEFAENFKGIEEVNAEYWQMKCQNTGAPGGSRWQGDWLPFQGEKKVEGSRIILVPTMGDPKQLATGTLKIRWIIPSVTAPVRVKGFYAYTRATWKDAQLTIRSTETGTGQVTLYNGAFSGTEPGLTRKFALTEPLKVDLRYCPPRPWQIADRTVLRFQLPGGSISVAVDDVLEKGAVYVAQAGLLVCDATKDQTIEAYRASIQGKQTILDRVRTMPDQTLEQAMEHLHRPEGDLGPTMLSLAADNCKFIAGRDGSLRFDDRPEVYNRYENAFQGEYRCVFEARFGSGSEDYRGRRLREDYQPIPVLTVAEKGMVYQQTTAVAPFGKSEKQGAPWWLTYRPMGLVEYQIKNTATTKQDFSLALSFASGPKLAAELARDGAHVLVRGNDHLLAVVALHDDSIVPEISQGTLTLHGNLDPLKTAMCTVYIPRWEGASVQDLAGVPSANQLFSDTEAYWQRIVGDGMRVEVPDTFMNSLIPASQVHCLMAARNENYTNIAPWISSFYYGPLESEANSVLRGMLAMGDDEFVRRGLEYYMTRYNKEGYVTTGYTLMGTGWHLWTLGEYYALTKNTDWMKKWAPEVARVCRWIIDLRHGTMRLDAHGEKVPEYGLMPPGVGADWEVYAYYFYLQGYYCAGLREASKALVDVGYEGAKEMLADAESYREDILRAYKRIQAQAPVFPLRNGTWVPEYPTHIFAPCPIGNLYVNEDSGRSWCYDVELGAHHLIPFGIIAPDKPEATWMIDHMEDVQFLRAGWFYYDKPEKNEADWFNVGGFAKVQPYYARTGEVHALRDDVKPFIRTYFNSIVSLVNREDLSIWEHFINGAYNKTHETGYFLHQSRLMFVQERGDELWLAPFVTSNWLRNGMRVAVDNAPTFFGKVSYALKSQTADGTITAHVDPPTRDSLRAIVVRMRHPEDKRLTRAECDGVKSFTVDSEKSTVRFIPSGGPVTVRAYYE